MQAEGLVNISSGRATQRGMTKVPQKNDRGSEVLETLVGQDQRKFLIKAKKTGSESLGRFAKETPAVMIPREGHPNLLDVELLNRDPQRRPHCSKGHPPPSLLSKLSRTYYVLIVVPEIPANSSPIEK